MPETRLQSERRPGCSLAAFLHIAKAVLIDGLFNISMLTLHETFPNTFRSGLGLLHC